VFYYTLSCQNNQETKTNDQPADITLVCPPSAAAAISTALNTNPFLTGLPYPRPDLLAPKDLDQNTGTAEILRLPELQAAVTSDFLVLPCDLVCELGADKLLQAWMVKSASLGDLLGVGGSNSNNANATRSGNGDATTTTGAAPAPRSGGLGVWYQTKTATPVKGEETDFIATVPLPASSVLPAKGSLFPHMSKLVYSMPTDSLKDLVEDRKGFPVRHGLLRRHPRIRMLTTHRDAHIYIFPHWVMQFIKENERLETIGEDVVGWWVKAGWQKGLSTKLGLDKILRGQGYGDSDNSNDRNSNGEEKQHASIRGGGGSSSRTLGVDSTTISAPTSVAPVSRVDSQGSNNSSSSSSPPSKTEAATITAADQNEPETADSDENLVPPMVAYIHPSQEESAPLIRRVDTAQLLLQTSLQLAKLPSLEETDTPSPFAHARKVAYPEGVKPRTTISRQDSLVADNVTVEEKTSIKESCIGANCQIGEGAKLSQCLLMDGVVVGRNCKLTKCILGRRSQLGEGCVLTDCEVQENLLVEAKSEWISLMKMKPLTVFVSFCLFFFLSHLLLLESVFSWQVQD
jgi:translation initiation factor eIF-2B subunit gamma